MWNILSIGNNNLRNAAFFPLADFGLLAFGINFFIDGGPKRWQAYTAAKQAEKKPMTAAARSSPFFLDDFVIPKNAGNLEKKAFFVASSIEPARIFAGYLIPNSKLGSISSLNPRYLIYKTIEFPTQKYAGYALPQDDVVYQNKIAYNSSSALSPSYQAAWQEETKPYNFPLVKPTMFSAPQFVYAETNTISNYGAVRPIIEVGNIIQPSVFIANYSFLEVPRLVGVPNSSQPLHFTPYIKIEAQKPNFETPRVKPAKTLDIIVGKTSHIQNFPFRMIYSINIGIPAPPKPANTMGIEATTMAAFAYLPQAKTDYRGTHPNYDTKQEFVDIGSSDFWRTSPYKGEYGIEKYPSSGKNFSKTPDGRTKNYRRRRKRKDDDLNEVKKIAKEKKQKTKPKSTAKHQKTSSRRKKGNVYQTKPQVAYTENKNVSFNYENGAVLLLSKFKSRQSHHTLDSVFEISQHGNSYGIQFDIYVKSLVKEIQQKAGYRNVGIFIINNKTGEFYDHGGATPMAAPSLNKVAIAFGVEYLIKKGDINPNDPIQLDTEQVHKNEIGKHPEYATSGTKFTHNEVRETVVRESGNTPANHWLKHHKEKINDVLEEVGLSDIKMGSPYLPGQPYWKHVGSPKSYAKLMWYIKSGKHLGNAAETLQEDLKNTTTGKDLKDSLVGQLRETLGTDVGVKVTFWEYGTGVAFSVGDISGAVILDGAMGPLYKDETVNSVRKRITTPYFDQSNRFLHEMLKSVKEYVLPGSIKTEHKKAA